MITNRLKSIITHLATHTTCYLSLFIILISFLIANLFPVYFRHDDVRHLEMVFKSNNPFIAFNPYKLELGHFRPIIHLAWWLLYHLFGLNPFPYHVFNLSIYGFSFLIFFKLVEISLSKRTAFFSLIAYFIVFFWLTYIPFSFAHMTATLEMFFINLSLYLLISSIKGKCSSIWGGLSYICAFLTREASLIIIPVIFSSYLLLEWKELSHLKQKKGIRSLAVICGLALPGLVFLIKLFTSTGDGSVYEISKITAFIFQRWNFYSRYLISDLGILILISTFYLSLRNLIGHKKDIAIKRFYMPLIISVIISFILRTFHNIALFVVFIAFIPILLKRLKESYAIVWFSISLFEFLFIVFMSRTYLTNASLGISIIMGTVLSDILSNLGAERHRLSPLVSKVLLALTIITLCSGIVMLAPKVRDKLDALYVVSAARMNFKDIFNFISANLNDSQTYLVILDEYVDMGINYFEEIHPLDDLEKARRQRTMEIETIEKLFRVAGKQNISFHNLQWFYNNHKVNSCFLLAMNNFEQNFVESLNIKKDIIYKSERNGERAILYHVAKK